MKPDYIICGTSRGADIALTLNELIDNAAYTVDNLKALPASPAAEGSYVVRARATAGFGGVYAWQATKPKNTNDGVAVIAPEAIAAWDGTEGDVSTLTAWTGVGNGAWVALALSPDSVSGEILEAKEDAISTAAIDATAKANAAREDAIAVAAIDATTKSDAAVVVAGNYINSFVTLGLNPLSNLEPNSNINLTGNFVGGDKWRGGVLAPNGKIYAIPSSFSQVLEIDPATNTTSLFGSLSGVGKWYGGVLAPNGKIYAIPFGATQVLEIDPATNTTALFGSLSGVGKWYGGVLAPNGKIYGIPADSTQVLEIDPATNTTALFGSLSGTNKWRGGVLAPNGKIYGMPADSTQVLEIRGVDGPHLWALSPYVNKL